MENLVTFVIGLIPLLVLLWIGVTLMNVRKELTAIRQHVTRWAPPPDARD